MFRLFTATLISMCYLSLHANDSLDSKTETIKVAVIGGMTMSGMWQKVSDAFRKEYAMDVEVVVTGPKHILDEYSRANDVDLVTMHSSDTMVNLVADGYFTNLLPWAANSQMLVSHLSNKAQIQNGDTLAKALAKIESTKSSFIVHASGGTFEVFNALKQRYHFSPNLFFTNKKRDFFDEVVEQNGYTLFGVIPFVMRKQYNKNVVGYFIDDNSLHRPYLSAIVNPKNTSKQRYKNAKLLQNFLVSKKVQTLIKEFRLEGYENIPLFFPIKKTRI